MPIRTWQKGLLPRFGFLAVILVIPAVIAIAHRAGAETAADVFLPTAPNCEAELIKTATVTAVNDDGDLLLADGTTARLAGLILVRRFDNAVSPTARRLNQLAAAAIALLRRRLVGQPVGLYGAGETQDRYGRLLADVYTSNGDWLQGTLLAAGYGRVFPFLAPPVCLSDMLAVERTARAARHGLWAFRTFAPLEADKPAAILRHTYSFQIVEGRVFKVATLRKWTFINFADDYRRDFTIAIAHRNAEALKAEGFDATALAGKRLRVRGFIERWNGPIIKLTRKEQIELLKDQ